MNKFKEIRPIVLGILVRDNKLLITSGYDSKKNNTFYRCLGGGIEFQETSTEALKREFKEELNIDIKVGEFCGVYENIFIYEGNPAHEIVFLYKITIDDKDYKEEYKVIDEDNTYATWVDINDFKTRKKIIYPEGIIDYL